MRNPILIIENPETRGTVDFIHEGVSVMLTIRDRELTIEVKASHGILSSELSWEDFSMLLPAEWLEQESSDE
jgi:hypothetical protein